MPRPERPMGISLGQTVAAQRRVAGVNRFSNWPQMVATLVLGSFLLSSPVTWGWQEPSGDYLQTVAPLLADKCLRCHQESRAEGDFRIDDSEQLAGYVVGGSLEESLLWTEHLAEDASNPMPPEDENDPLTAEQRVVIRTWIEAGGQQQPVADWNKLTASAQALEKAADWQSVLWTLHGRLHPAVLHFPVALISVAALFALLAFGNVHMDKAAMYCLGLGTIGACVAVSTGWGFAEHKQWAAWETELGNQESWWETVEAALASSKFLHRWGGVVVAGLSVLVFLLAFVSRLNPSRSQFWWKASLVLVAGLVGFVGHLGGKLSHGDLYSEPLARLQEVLTAAPAAGEPTVDDVEQSTDKPMVTPADANSEEKANTAETTTQSVDGIAEESAEKTDEQAAGDQESSDSKEEEAKNQESGGNARDAGSDTGSDTGSEANNAETGGNETGGDDTGGGDTGGGENGTN